MLFRLVVVFGVACQEEVGESGYILGYIAQWQYTDVSRPKKVDHIGIGAPYLLNGLLYSTKIGTLSSYERIVKEEHDVLSAGIYSPSRQVACRLPDAELYSPRPSRTEHL